MSSNERRKRRKQEALQEARRFFHDWPENFDVIEPWHWQFTVGEDRLDYWPTTGKWLFRGEYYKGSPEDLKQFICDTEAEGHIKTVFPKAAEAIAEAKAEVATESLRQGACKHLYAAPLMEGPQANELYCPECENLVLPKIVRINLFDALRKLIEKGD